MPVAPDKTMAIAMVVAAPNESNVTLFVRAEHGYHLNELHDVYAPSPNNDDLLKWNAASGRWENSNSINLSGVSVSGNAVVTGEVVRPSETGSFITTSQTGQFVGDSETGAFLTTGAADGRYALQSETGVFVTTGQTGQFVTGAVVRPTETGAFLTTGAADARYALQSATGDFITTSQTGAFAAAANTGAFLTTGAGDSRYALQSATGDFITTNQTGVFYPTSNPSGYITGVDLSAYVTGSVVRPSETGNFITTSQTGQFVGDSETGAFLTTSTADGKYVLLTGHQTISGDKTFANKLITSTGFFGTANTYGNFNYQTIAGGYSNQVSGEAASIIGGDNNSAIGNYSCVGGGLGNSASGNYAFAGGGLLNNSNGAYSVIVGGLQNKTRDSFCFIGGGANNNITGDNSNSACIAGGFGNSIIGYSSSIAGGYFNSILGFYSNVAGGFFNQINASSAFSNIAGGFGNLITKDNCNIPGGYGAVADRYGMEARASSFFIDKGDAQKIAFTLYCDTVFDTKFFLDGLDQFDIFSKQNVGNSAAFVTCQLIGHDSIGNISQIHRKLVIKKEGSVQTIVHLESIGTDLVDAGTVNFSTSGNVFFIEPAIYSYRTYWIAHVYGVEIVRPTEYS
jgi:hypothetical protein